MTASMPALGSRARCTRPDAYERSTITDGSGIIRFLQQHGMASILYLENSPSIDITESVRHLYEKSTI